MESERRLLTQSHLTSNVSTSTSAHEANLHPSRDTVNLIRRGCQFCVDTYVAGGLLIVGITVGDNSSGFATITLTPDGRKTAAATVQSLTDFYHAFPAVEHFRTLYSDNGSAFKNYLVQEWCDGLDIKYRQTKVAPVWSNGKAERLQAIIKREVFIPIILARRDDSIAALHEALDTRMGWYNLQRPHFGHINRGLTPGRVANACAGQGEEERERLMANLRLGTRWKNRAQWEKSRVRTPVAESIELIYQEVEELIDPF